MSCRIAYDPVDDIAVMYDSVTGTAFGPIIEHTGGTERMEKFIESLPNDPRSYLESDLRVAYNLWTLDNPIREEDDDEAAPAADAGGNAAGDEVAPPA